MIPKECKRLAEVDFPIADVSRHSAREKSIHLGHPSTLHYWWARRPLAACRSMLLALLLPDPCDPLCPSDFKSAACDLLAKVQGRPKSNDMDLRRGLLGFIGDFANWDLSSDERFLEVGRGLVKAAHPEETPLVVDPFAGGGSIPLETLRLGCDAIASDLNPVACLILKVLLEDIPRHGQALAVELLRAGAEIKAKAEKELAEFYPRDPDGSQPIAYLWARTVRCEAPKCGAEIPLVRSHWLCKKPNRKLALRHSVVRPKGEPPRVEYAIYKPKNDDDIQPGTVSRAKATCPCCHKPLAPARVRAQLSVQRGGADTVFDARGNRIGGARLLAVVSLKPSGQGRNYRLPSTCDYAATRAALAELARVRAEWTSLPADARGLNPTPDEVIPLTDLRRVSIPIYGMTRWSDCYTARQSLTLLTMVKHASSCERKSETARLLALTVSRLVNALNTFCRWHLTRENIEGAYSRQALGMVWDFCEGSLLSGSTGSFAGAMDWVLAVIGGSVRTPSAQVQRADAAESSHPSDAADLWFTDPPYYDSIPYAHLSDLVFVWFRRMQGPSPRLGFVGDQTPKKEECVADRPHTSNPTAKTGADYELKMSLSMTQGRRVIKPSGLGCVVFAHKTTEGWEALLSGMVEGGWTITGSWPIETEMKNKVGAAGKAILLASVHLVCRPRAEDAPAGDWNEVLRELPNRVGDWMERLQSEGVRGADLVFACIGPALEIFSRYSRVEAHDKAEVRDVSLAEYLEKVWEVVGRTALEQILGTAEAKARNGAAGALEEDARLTALFLWTLQSTVAGDAAAEAAEEEVEAEEDDAPRTKAKGFSLVRDVARRFAQPMGIELDDWEARIIETKAGVVRLLAVTERANELFGEETAQTVADELEKSRGDITQLKLFADEEPSAAPEIKTGRQGRKSKASGREPKARRGATTLDRVHAAMLLQRSGRSNALRALLKAEVQRGPDFLRLANALSALYPKDCEEKRLLDAMLLAVPR